MFCALSTYSLAQNWVGTWATAPQTVVRSFMPYNNCMTNRSVRQVVKVSIGGDVIRLKLSNIYSMQPVEIRSIYIAHAKDSSDIDAKTAQYFKFGNSYKTIIPAGKQIVSNALKFNSGIWSVEPLPSTTHRLPKFQPCTWVRAPPPIS